MAVLSVTAATGSLAATLLIQWRIGSGAGGVHLGEIHFAAVMAVFALAIAELPARRLTPTPPIARYLPILAS